MLPAIMAGVGAIAGSQADVANSNQTSGIRMAPASANELDATKAIGTNFTQLQNFVGNGPGSDAITNANSANESLASLLKKFSQGGFLPGDEDFATANKFASQAFQPQQVALQQNFQGQQQRAAQLAAQLGRPVNDPIIQAKLSQEYMQGQERLGAAQGAYSSQMALQLPQQRLGYTSQLADVRNSLASQAMANRQALLSLGSQIQGSEREFRMQSGTRYGNTEQISGGGLKGALSGAIGGLGAGLGAQGMMGQQGLQAAQAQYYNSAANQLPAFAAAANRGPAMAAPMGAQPMGAAPSLSSAAPSYNVPFALQQPSNFNSMPNTGYSFPQFNIFGQMTPGTEAFSSPNGYAPGGIQPFAPGMIPNGGNGLGF